MNKSVGVNSVYEILQMRADMLTQFTTYNAACKEDLENKK